MRKPDKQTDRDDLLILGSHPLVPWLSQVAHPHGPSSHPAPTLHPAPAELCPPPTHAAEVW